MMFAVVYLSVKLGQVAGKGLFAVIRDNYPKWILYSALAGVLFGNVIEAAADIGGMAAAINLLVPIPFDWIVIGVAVAILSLQIWGSYVLIRNIFRTSLFCRPAQHCSTQGKPTGQVRDRE
jgi:Mn2+/Fe2+ NRAMP family transporter